MKIIICIGSSCHIKGSRHIVEEMQSIIKREDLGDRIELGGAFCMGNCQNGVCITVDGESHSLTPEQTENFFERTIKPKLLVN